MIKYLRHMVVFYHIVDSGSVSAAADRLGLSKSVISQQLKDLETELGVTLLNRNTRKQALTNAGEAFFNECLKLNQIATNAWDSVTQVSETVSGNIRISAPNAFIDFLVAPAMSRLLKSHPELKPELFGDDQRVDLVQQQIDLAIRVGALPSSDYKQRRIGSFRDVLCGSPEYIAQSKVRDQISLLDGCNPINACYIANTWQGKKIQHTLVHDRTGDLIQLSFEANRICNSLPTVISLVRSGCGLAFIPDFIYAQHKDVLVEAFPGYRSDLVPIFALYPHSGQPPMAVKVSIEAVKEEADNLFTFEQMRADYIKPATKEPAL